MFLVDTNVISEPSQLRPNQAVIDWLLQNDDDLAISAMTIGELKAGITELPLGRKKAGLEQWLEQLRADYYDAILPFDENVAITWGVLIGEQARKGRKIPAADSILAATALHHGFTLATRNEKDFANTGVRLINPWNQ